MRFLIVLMVVEVAAAGGGTFASPLKRPDGLSDLRCQRFDCDREFQIKAGAPARSLAYKVLEISTAPPATTPTGP